MLPVCMLIWDEILLEFWSQKILPRDFLVFVGNGIGIPVLSGIKFSGIQGAQNLVAQRISRKCWINITEISVASRGSRPFIR